MKNIFELFGFLSMACISAAIIFIVMGKKDGLKSFATETLTPTEFSEVANAPKSVTKGSRDSYASDSGSARRAKGSRETSTPTLSGAAAEDLLKKLYKDAAFVSSATKKWNSLVSDIADEYNVKPQLLLSNAIIRSYLGSYSRADLVADAAEHAGDRVWPVAKAAQRYPYSWSVQKVADQYNLASNFAKEIPTAAATANPMISSKNSSKGGNSTKSVTPKVTPTAQISPVESGFQNMVAKEYGFNSWNGLQRLGDTEMKAGAQRRVKSLMMAARIK